MLKKILIIEDDITLNEMYSMKFRIEWFEVESAFEWEEWLDKITTFQPDIILLDIMMPWMNWFDTIKVIKEQNKSNVKVIMFTNLNDKQSKEKAKELWADDFILKADTTPKQAVEIVNNVLNNN